MAALIIAVYGFEPHRVYFEMGLAEFYYYFLNAFLLLTRAQQMQSTVLMSSIGSFFVKDDQKTFIEILNEQARDIWEILGNQESDYEAITEKTKPKDPLEDLFRQISKSNKFIARRI